MALTFAYIAQRPTADTADNHGFDDERGDYLWVMHDHVSFRYEILGVLGKGSFGVVTKCYDWKTNQLVSYAPMLMSSSRY